MWRPARLASLLWASPWTALGMVVGLLGLATGGRARRRGPVVEFYGGAVAWLLRRCPGKPGAMTLGHTVLGQTATILDAARSHELVHVRQYQRWGPLFVPAYLLCSLVLWLAGKDAYRENPFEREAYAGQSSQDDTWRPKVTGSKPRVYLALGDSMSIDDYTGVAGGGAVNQFYRSLGGGWKLADRTFDGCRMYQVPTRRRGDLITLTIGGNDLLVNQQKYLAEGGASFAEEHLRLLRAVRKANPQACLIVGNIYAPQTPLPASLLAGLDLANAQIEANAAEVAARLADIREAFRGHEQEYLCYEIEPNLQGATVIAGLFRKAFGKGGQVHFA